MAEQPKILVVDDEEVILLSVRRVLKKDDYAIDTVMSANDAVRKMDETVYDVVITDLMMPGMTGMELLERIGEMKLATRAIMITGFATMKTAMQAMQRGAFDYVAKPFTKDELRSVVLRAVRSRPTDLATAGEQEAPAISEDPLEAGRVYTLRNHAWARIREDGQVTIGLAPSLLAATGALLSVEAPEVGEHVHQGKACARLIAEDAQTHVLWSPLSGRVMEVNRDILENPRLAGGDPMGRGWLMVIDPTAIESEIENLL